MDNIGKLITRNQVEEALSEQDLMDAFTPEDYLRAFDELHALHELHKFIAGSHIIISGDIGSGVSLVAASLCMLASKAGAQVYSDGGNRSEIWTAH